MSIGVVTLHCPECGGTINAPEGKDTCFCPFCGSQLFIDTGNRTVTFRTVDEAKIRKAEADLQRAKSVETVELRKLEVEVQERRRRMKLLLISMAVLIALVVIGIALVCTQNGFFEAQIIGIFMALFAGGALMGLAPRWFDFITGRKEDEPDPDEG